MMTIKTSGPGIHALLPQRDLGVTEKHMVNEEFIKTLEASREIELTVTGRTSGREISIPVWFVREGGKLYLVRSMDRTPAGTRTC